MDMGRTACIGRRVAKGRTIRERGGPFTTFWKREFTGSHDAFRAATGWDELAAQQYRLHVRTCDIYQLTSQPQLDPACGLHPHTCARCAVN